MIFVYTSHVWKKKKRFHISRRNVDTSASENRVQISARISAGNYKPEKIEKMLFYGFSWVAEGKTWTFPFEIFNIFKWLTSKYLLKYLLVLDVCDYPQTTATLKWLIFHLSNLN